MTSMSYTEMAQLELMNAAANVTSQEDLDALRLTLSLFFAERAQKAIDKMWDEGTFDQKKLDELVAIKSKNELIADVVALLQSPIKNVVSAINAGGKIHGLLDAIAERNQ